MGPKLALLKIGAYHRLPLARQVRYKREIAAARGRVQTFVGVRRSDGMSSPRRDRRLKRFLVEYVANLDATEGKPATGVENSETIPDRRVNHQARRMVDWFKQEMQARELSPDKERALLNGVRELIREEAREGAEAEVASDAVEETDRG
jgi:hypothetical protein